MKMNYESRVIEMINSVMPDSPLRISRCFESDSEVIYLGGRKYLFTTDDFSKEDLFHEKDPYVLGWNIGCASVSDIIAAGGIPLIYSHSMVISRNWEDKYIEAFAKGIAEVLKTYSISFAGGDLGISENWRYTSTVIGKCGDKILNRKGVQPGDSIFLTGEIGRGNLNAALSLFSYDPRIKELSVSEKNIFRTHEHIARALSKYASAAIDTSDGVYSALRILSELNGKGYIIDSLPFITGGVRVSKSLNLPSELLFLGECGEYEILFTVGDNKKSELIKEIHDLGLTVYEIGKFTGNSDEKIILMNGKRTNLKDYDLNARDFVDVKEYLGELIAWVNR